MDCQPVIDRIASTQANNQPNCKAAAQLSDAAPDMLEALQHIMRCIPIGGFAQIHYGSSTWQQIDAAITKALGDPI